MKTSGLETFCFQLDEEYFVYCKRLLPDNESDELKLVVINHSPYILETRLTCKEGVRMNGGYIVDYKEAIKRLNSLFRYTVSESTEKPSFDLKPVRFVFAAYRHYTVYDVKLYNYIIVDSHLTKFLFYIPPRITFVLESDSYFINGLFRNLCAYANCLYEAFAGADKNLSFYSEGNTTFKMGRRLIYE
ncbi:MAG: hypothetical protein KatS3mg083_629 [Candidatus Dojkabacteria bacterium]|nr:MAG: hypothetical protein KatS3mg083_629 [Candidatus Dojkabacteria bacterium]